MRHFAARGGAKVTEWLIRSALQLRRTSLTAELVQRSAHGPAESVAGEQLGTKLNLIANTTVGPVRLRGTAQLGLDSRRRGLETTQFVAEAPLGQQSSLRLGYEHDVVARRDEVMLGWVRQFDRFALRTEGRLDSRGRLSFGLTLGFSLGADPLAAARGQTGCCSALTGRLKFG